MKGLPEKLMLAAIILSCGFVAHSAPSARDGSAQRATRNLHKWQAPPAAAAAIRGAKLNKEVAARADNP
jgi:hypothetical protein